MPVRHTVTRKFYSDCFFNGKKLIVRSCLEKDLFCARLSPAWALHNSRLHEPVGHTVTTRVYIVTASLTKKILIARACLEKDLFYAPFSHQGTLHNRCEPSSLRVPVGHIWGSMERKFAVRLLDHGDHVSTQAVPTRTLKRRSPSDQKSYQLVY